MRPPNAHDMGVRGYFGLVEQSPRRAIEPCLPGGLYEIGNRLAAVVVAEVLNRLHMRAVEASAADCLDAALRPRAHAWRAYQ